MHLCDLLNMVKERDLPLLSSGPIPALLDTTSGVRRLRREVLKNSTHGLNRGRKVWVARGDTGKGGTCNGGAGDAAPFCSSCVKHAERRGVCLGYGIYEEGENAFDFWAANSFGKRS